MATEIAVIDGYEVEPVNYLDKRNSWICWQAGQRHTRQVIISTDSTAADAAILAAAELDKNATIPTVQRRVCVEVSPNACAVISLRCYTVRQWRIKP